MIKAIFFDFSQTLVDSADGFRTAEKAAERKIYTDLGLGSWNDFLKNYRKIRKDFHSRATFSRKTIWKKVYEYYCQQPNESLLKNWEHEYWQEVKCKTETFPETHRVLDKLSCKYQLALITNTQGEDFMEKHRVSEFPWLKRFFKEIIVAGESGVPPKPDPTPFRVCLKRLGMEVDQAVFVGDDWQVDIRGAFDAGLHPIWLKHHSLSRNWPNVKIPIPVITSLEELLNLEEVLSVN